MKTPKHNFPVDYLHENPKLCNLLHKLPGRFVFRRLYRGPIGIALRIPINRDIPKELQNPGVRQGKMTYQCWEVMCVETIISFTGEGDTPLSALENGYFERLLWESTQPCR